MLRPYAKGNSVFMKIAHDGWAPTISSGLIAVAAFWISPFIALLVGLITVGLAWFFRDPKRDIPSGDVWVSPADGKVVEIGRTFHPFTGECLKIGIFMSPLNVHINRMPCQGRVEYLEYAPGRKWMAFAPKASELNERMYVGIGTAAGNVLIVQIAGFLARRIVCRLEKGADLDRGERFGMIKLGSRVDVYIPPSIKPLVCQGQRVKAGETVIGVYADETA